MSYTAREAEILVGVAKSAIEHGIVHPEAPTIDELEYGPALRRRRASFVTLRKRERLRGCVGGLEATKPLVADVAQ